MMCVKLTLPCTQASPEHPRCPMEEDVLSKKAKEAMLVTSCVDLHHEFTWIRLALEISDAPETGAGSHDESFHMGTCQGRAA